MELVTVHLSEIRNTEADVGGASSFVRMQLITCVE